jgi:hypothetical protein
MQVTPWKISVSSFTIHNLAHSDFRWMSFFVSQMGLLCTAEQIWSLVFFISGSLQNFQALSWKYIISILILRNNVMRNTVFLSIEDISKIDSAGVLDPSQWMHKSKAVKV